MLDLTPEVTLHEERRRTARIVGESMEFADGR
jgi:hypothetical protein